MSVAAIIASGVNQDGRREILGLGLGDSEVQVFWMDCLRRWRQRGLSGIQLIISDAHEGLKAAISQVFTASWQRCRVHFLRNLLACVPKTGQSLAGTLVRQVFVQPDAKSAQFETLHRNFPSGLGGQFCLSLKGQFMLSPDTREPPPSTAG